jgi:hypothetical protein
MKNAGQAVGWCSETEAMIGMYLGMIFVSEKMRGSGETGNYFLAYPVSQRE